MSRGQSWFCRMMCGLKFVVFRFRDTSGRYASVVEEFDCSLSIEFGPIICIIWLLNFHLQDSWLSKSCRSSS